MISPLSGRVSPVETDGKREQVLPRVVEDPLLPITVVIDYDAPDLLNQLGPLPTSLILKAGNTYSLPITCLVIRVVV